MHSTFSNPIADARHSTGVSLQHLGKRVGLSRQYLSRAEQGTYSGLNKDLVNFTSKQLGISVREVVRRYEAFQVMTRKFTAESLQPVPLQRGKSNEPGYVIFERWRSGYWNTATAFSNGFCVHPEIVRNYEDGQLPGIPDPVKSALESVGLIASDWAEGPERLLTAARGA